MDKCHLSQEQTDACNAITGMMKCNVDQKTDVITIDVNTQAAKVAALVADTVLNYLQNFIIEYRTNKAKNDLQYVEGIYSEAKDTYESARRKYAAFCDANQEVELPSLQSEMEEMENDMQLKYTNYTQLQQQLQMAQAKLRERTPSFTVIQSATVALKKSKPKRMIIVGLFFAVAFFGTYLVAARLEDKKKDKKKVVKEEIVPNDSEEPIEDWVVKNVFSDSCNIDITILLQ